MKNFKSLAAFTAASMISLASVATPIFAANAETTFRTEVSSEKGLLSSSSSTIEYEVVPADGAPYNESAPAGTHFAGKAGMFNVTAAGRNDENATDKSITYQNSTIGVVSGKTFDGPGIFCYTLQPNSTGTEDNNKGIEISDQKIPMYVMVGYGDDGQLEVLSYSFGVDGKLNDPTFTHTYSPSELTIKKVVDGNQGDKNKKFAFTLVVNNAPGKTFNVPEGTTSTENEDGTTSYTFNLSHNETFAIDGLTADDYYIVSEVSEEYTPSYTVEQGTTTVKTGTTEGDSKADSTGEINVQNKTDDQVTFTNYKNGNVPTGILMTAAPYVAVVGLGGVFAGMFFRRKRED